MSRSRAAGAEPIGCDGVVNLAGRFLRRVVPRTLEARGRLVIGLTAVVAALPTWLAYRTWADARSAESAAEAVLPALTALAIIERQGAGADAAGAGSLARVADRVLWLGVLGPDGAGSELRRAGGPSYAELTDHIAALGRGPARAPLTTAARAAGAAELRIWPLPDGGRLAAVVATEAPAATWRTPVLVTGCVAGGAAGLALVATLFRRMIVAPTRQLVEGVAAALRGEVQSAVHEDVPHELRKLADATQRLGLELERAQAAAVLMRVTVDEQVDARLRQAEQARRRAEREALTDPLTQLASRRGLERALPALCETERARGGDLALVVADVDRFKAVNDRFEHAAGDRVLSFVGELLRATVRRGTDVAARLGGDEFVLVLPGTDARRGQAVAERLAALFAQRIRALTPLEPPPALSTGVVTLRQHPEADWKTLLALADAAMYAVKRRVRD